MKSKALVVLITVLLAAVLLSDGGTVAAQAPAPTRTLERAVAPDGLGPDGLRRPASAVGRESVEVIVELQDNSLAAERVSRRGRGLPDLDSSQQREYVRALKGKQEDVRGRLERLGAKVTHNYQKAFNGLSVRADASRLAEIEALPGVKAVYPVRLVALHLDNSVPFILGGQTHEELGVDGTGVTIAVIDTGIDYTHAALGGSGDPDDYADNDPLVVEPGTFPTAKVVGGIDLVGEFFDARCPDPNALPTCTDVPTPDADPLDTNGHGTHVAGIAASIGAGEVPVGVAPGASLFAIKVFSDAFGDGNASTTNAIVVAAIEAAVDPNGDGDTSDAVDVINMSLGSEFGRDTEPDAVATNAAAELGVIVVASAGNSGDIPYITGSPAAASKAISVAAGNDPGVLVQLLEVSGSNGADGSYESVELSFTPPLSTVGPVSGPTTFVGLACDQGGPGGPNPFPPGALAGQIPLIARGVCRFDEKVQNAEEAGAIAAVIYNNVPGGGPFAGAGDPIVNIPAVMIGNADGLAIRAALQAGTTFILDPANVLPIPDRLQGFTSRGPRFNDSALKPDITAPGGSILSAALGTGTGAFNLSGTSMAAPHIAGVAALLRQLHPDWSVEETKALMMNTTTNASPNGEPYPVSRMGSGRVQVDVAVDTESVAMPGSLSFGLVQRDKPGQVAINRKVTVINKSDSQKRFQLSTAFLFPSDDEGSVSFQHPGSLTVPAGKSRDFTLTARINVQALSPESAFEEYDGFLTLVETTDGDDVLRVPFHVVPTARADARAKGKDGAVELRNTGLTPTLADIYQLGVTDANEDLISEPAGSPEEPDDWFDIRYAGAHAFDVPDLGRIVEFGVSVHGNRSAANPMVTDVLLDVDKDGTPDYDVVAADLGLFTTGNFDGRIATAIFELKTGAGVLEFLTANDRNVSWQTIPILLEDLNSLGEATGAPTISPDNPDFDYFVVTTDLLSEAFDFTDSARFNAVAPELEAVVSLVEVAPGDRFEVPVVGTVEEGELLVLFYNNISGKPQSAAVEVELD